MSLAFKYVDHLVSQQMKGFYAAFAMEQPNKENSMNLREALINQSPSLALQRAAADEIAELDKDNEYILSKLNKTVDEREFYKSRTDELEIVIEGLEKELREAYSNIDYYRNRDFPETRY